MREPFFSVIVPVYNSEASLPELTRRLELVFRHMEKTFEIIFVDDCSRDRSFETLREIKGKTDIAITLVRLAKNCGQQCALMCGFQYAAGECIVTLDDDLQNPPEEIPKLYDKIAAGADAVFASYRKKRDKLHKNLGSFLVRKLNQRIFRLPRHFAFSSFRIVRKRIVDEIKQFHTPFPYVSGMIVSLTGQIANAEVEHEKRKYGRSNYTLKKLVGLSLNPLLNYSGLPLRLIGLVGFAVSMISFAIGLYFMVIKLLAGQAPAGWASLIVLMSFNNAILLAILFVFGEYISRILREISPTRTYPVREVIR